MRRGLALVVSLAAACGKGGELTTLEGGLELAPGLSLDQIRLRQVLLAGQPVPGSEGLLFPNPARPIKTGDTFTLRFADSDAGKVVQLRAEGLVEGRPVTAIVEESATLQAGAYVRARLRFQALVTEVPDAGSPDGPVPADTGGSGGIDGPARPDTALPFCGSNPLRCPGGASACQVTCPPAGMVMGCTCAQPGGDASCPPCPGPATCGPPGGACASPGTMCGFACPNGGNVNCTCTNGTWSCPLCPITGGCGPPGGACSQRGTTCSNTCPGGTGQYTCTCSMAGTWSCTACGGAPTTMCNVTSCVPNMACTGDCYCFNPNPGTCPGGNYACRCTGGVLQCLCCGPRLFCPQSNPAATCAYRCPSGGTASCSCPTEGGNWSCPACQ